MHVLIADDALSLRVLLLAVFRRCGHEVSLAESAPAAIAHLNEIDVLLLDLSMAPEHGFSVLEHLVAVNPSFLHRVLVLTAMPASVDAILQPLSVIHKPFDLDVLVQQVETLGSTPLVTTPVLLPRLAEWRGLPPKWFG